LPVLTGAPATTYNHESYEGKPDKLWKIIEHADKASYIMTTAVSSSSEMQEESAPEVNAQEVATAGLVDEHAYSLIAAVDVHISFMNNEKFVMIRNPWGFKEWSGKWSDNSKMWKEYPDAEKNIRKELANRGSSIEFNLKANDGCFWMSFKDYLKFFYLTSICHVEQGWHSNWISDILDGSLGHKSAAHRQENPEHQIGVLHFSVSNDLHSTSVLSLNQINSRHIDETMLGSYKYAPVKVAVAKECKRKVKEGESPKNDLVFVEGDYFDGQTLSLRLDSLTKGEYFVFYSYEWSKLHPVRKTIFNLYAESKIDIKRIDDA